MFNRSLSRVGTSAALLFTLALVGCRSSGPMEPMSNLASRWMPGGPSGSTASSELKNPKNTHFWYARWQESIGNFEEARKSYQVVLGEDKKSVDAVIGLARIDQLSGRTREAEMGFEKALRMKPGEPKVLDAVGQFYASEKRWSEAVAKLNEAMLADPLKPEYQHHLAVALARSGNVEAAMPHFVKTVGDAQAHYNIGFILKEQGRLAEAEARLEQAVALEPELTEAQTLLTELKRKLDGAKVTRQGETAVLPAAGTTPPQETRFNRQAGATGRSAPVSVSASREEYTPPDWRQSQTGSASRPAATASYDQPEMWNR